MKYPIILHKDDRLPLSLAEQLFGDIAKDEQHLDIKTCGPWQTITSAKGLCMKEDFETGQLTIYGYRTMADVRQAGYGIEGCVSVLGKKYSAFNSNHIFELENGHLINVGIIFPRVKS